MTGIAAKSAFDHLSEPNLNTEDVQDVERASDAPTSPASLLPAAPSLPTVAQGAIGKSGANDSTANTPVLPNQTNQAAANAAVLTDSSQSEAMSSEANVVPPISHRCLAHPHWTGCRAMYDAHQRAMNTAMVADSNETVLDLPDTDTHTSAGNDTWSAPHKYRRPVHHERHFLAWLIPHGHH